MNTTKKQNLSLINRYFIEFLYENLDSILLAGLTSGIVAFIIFIFTKQPIYFIIILLFLLLVLFSIHSEIYSYHFKKENFKNTISEDTLNNMKNYSLKKLTFKFFSVIFVFFASSIITFFAIILILFLSMVYILIYAFIIISVVSFLSKLF